MRNINLYELHQVSGGLIYYPGVAMPADVTGIPSRCVVEIEAALQEFYDNDHQYNGTPHMAHLMYSDCRAYLKTYSDRVRALKVLSL